MVESSSVSASQSKKLSVSLISTDCSSVRSLDSDDPVFLLRIPNRLLLEWHSDSSRSSYIEQLNGAIVDGVVHVDVHCDRLERRIAR